MDVEECPIKNGSESAKIFSLIFMSLGEHCFTPSGDKAGAAGVRKTAGRRFVLTRMNMTNVGAIDLAKTGEISCGLRRGRRHPLQRWADGNPDAPAAYASVCDAVVYALSLDC